MRAAQGSIADVTAAGRAGALRRDPQRVLFPVGALLAAAGVVPWLVFAFGVTETYRAFFRSLAYRAIFHPLAEVEGFLTCFAAGFVLAVVPRRTGTPPAAAWQVAAAAAAPVAGVVAAWLERWTLAQLAWLALLAVLLEFALRRVRGAALASARAAWIPFGLAMGAAGAIIGAIGAASGRAGLWLHDLGRGLLLQGLFTCLVLGSAELLLAVPRRGDARPPRTDWALHGGGALLLAASFGVGAHGWLRLAFAARAALALAALAAPLRAAVGGGARRAATGVALVMLPAGNALVALAPRYPRAGLHLVYLGCFAALALALPASPAAERPPPPERALARRTRLAWAGALLGVALAARLLLELDPASFHLWLGTSCAAFLGAVSLGAALALERRADLARRAGR